LTLNFPAHILSTHPPRVLNILGDGHPNSRRYVTGTTERRIVRAMATNIRPLHDRVIVRRIEEAEQVRGGIIIPDTAKEKPQEGEVIAVGEGKYKEDGTRQPLDVKAGDRVLFGKYSGSEIKIDGEEFLIMREDEILGILERAGAATGSKKGK
jgi:chaperonin GroES